MLQSANAVETLMQEGKSTKDGNTRVVPLFNSSGDEKNRLVYPMESGEQKTDRFDRRADVVNHLPDALRTMVLAMAESYQVKSEMIIGGLLGVISSAMMGGFAVSVKGDYTEPSNLYTLTVAEPSERKSPIFNALKKPLEDFVSSYNKTHQIEFNLAKRRLKVAENRATSAQNEYERNVNDVQAYYNLRDAEERLIEAQEECKKNQPLGEPLGDVTSEALGMYMSGHREKALLYSDEGDGVAVLAGKYNSGSATIGLLCNAFSGNRYELHRVSRDHVSLENPLISIVMFVQPTVLQDCISNRDFMGKGLMYRFLISMPESLMGKRAIRTPDFDGKDADYIRVIQTILKMVTVSDGVRTIKLSEGARDAFELFSKKLERNINGALADIRGFVGKLPGITARIASILHTAGYVLKTPLYGEVDRYLNAFASQRISSDCMEHAIAIAEYYIGEALYIYNTAGEGWVESEQEKFTQNIRRKIAKAVRSQNKCIHQEAVKNGRYYMTERDLQRLFHFSEFRKKDPSKVERHMEAVNELASLGQIMIQDKIYYIMPELLR